MKVTCLQMSMKLGCPEENFSHAEELICEGIKEQPDVIVLPETWNTGFFPKEKQILSDIRGSIPVFRDRRPGLYF